MTTARVSSKGQVTLPALVRRRLSIAPKSNVDIDVRGNEIVIKPIKSIRDLRGVFHDYAQGKTEDWETVRRLTEEAVAEEVANEGRS